MSQVDLFQLIPGLREAVEREQTARDQAFLVAPEFISGVPVRPLTLADLCALETIGSPFIVGGELTPEDVALFLWALSPEFNRAHKWRAALEYVSFRLGAWMFRRIRSRYIARLRDLDGAATAAEIREYVNTALADAPKGDPGKSGPNYWSYHAGVVGIVASVFGWTEAEIMRIPLRRLFQYLKIAFKKLNPDAALFNPSQALIGRWINEQNAKNQQQKENANGR